MPGRKERGAVKTAGVISLGCSKNLVDTEFIMGGLVGCGWSFTAVREEAELLLVNTCAFLDSAVREADEAILEAVEWKRTRGRGTVVVAGCLVSRGAGNLEELYPEVDLFLLPGQIERLPEWLSAPRPRPRRMRGGGASYLPGPGAGRTVTSGSWAYLKISDGCDNRCSYCLIPSIRGGHRSRSLQSIRREARSLVEAGVREINLVGQDITRWSAGGGRRGLEDLVRGITSLPGDFRVRLLYLHPSRVDERICGLLAEDPKVFPYLDMPIQHASAKVLRGMGRPYGRRLLEKTWEMLRRRVPGIALRTTVMVGFPGEGEGEFADLLAFLRGCPFENLGAFAFSPQVGTAAAKKNRQVPPAEAQRRYHTVMRAQKGIARALWKRRRGERTEALVLGPSPEGPGLWRGRTAWQAPEVDGHVDIAGEASPGRIVRVRITGSGPYDLEGAVLP